MTIHEHLDETVSIRFGPHTVGRFDAGGEPLNPGAKGDRAARRDQPAAQEIAISPFPFAAVYTLNPHLSTPTDKPDISTWRRQLRAARLCAAGIHRV